jgi:hypothetical protein
MQVLGLSNRSRCLQPFVKVHVVGPDFLVWLMSSRFGRPRSEIENENEHDGPVSSISLCSLKPRANRDDSEAFLQSINLQTRQGRPQRFGVLRAYPRSSLLKAPFIMREILRVLMSPNSAGNIPFGNP